MAELYGLCATHSYTQLLTHAGCFQFETTFHGWGLIAPCMVTSQILYVRECRIISILCRIAGDGELTLSEMFEQIKHCRYIRHYYPDGTPRDDINI